VTLGTSTRASLVSGSLRVRSCCRHAQAYRAFADDPDVGYPATHDARTILWHLAFVGIDTGDLAQIESAAIDAVDAPPTATATTPTPEVGSSGTRSCAVSNITNGQDIAARPSALYVTCNLEVVGNGGGWVEVDYGVGGNVTQLTVHGECTSGSNPEEHGTRRVEDLSGNWVCETEQHFEYRWDELNRIVEARRWDRTGGYSSASGWTFEARQRYRYDGANQRTVKESFDTSLGDSRVALYVYPGDFERRGVTRGSMEYESATTGYDTETQYLVAGARLVWDHGSTGGTGMGELDRNRRLTMGVGDLIGTTAASVDLLSGELLEVSTYYPNGARETLRTNAGIAVPLEPMGFTGKEADEDVGLVYFGERYLLARLGRWASPDPLHVHASGGGEALNSYHYVSGNLLQARDPTGLGVGDGTAERAAAGSAPPEPSEDDRAARDLARAEQDGRSASASFARLGEIAHRVNMLRRHDAPDYEVSDTDMLLALAAAALETLLGAIQQDEHGRLAIADRLYSEHATRMSTDEGYAAGYQAAERERRAARSAETARVRDPAHYIADAATVAIPMIALGAGPTSSPYPLAFSQTTASFAFNAEGAFAGETVLSVAEGLRAGELTASSLPIRYVMRDGTRLIVNTRSSLALTRAGVPTSEWLLIDATGDAAVEAEITRRLAHNGLTSSGTPVLRATGLGPVPYPTSAVDPSAAGIEVVGE